TAKALDRQLTRQMGKIAAHAYPYPESDEVLVPDGEEVTPEHKSQLAAWLAARLGDLEAEARRQQENSAVLTGAERDQRRYMAQQQAGDLAGKSNSEVDAIKKELVAQIDELESLERLQLLSEQRVRELQDAYPGVFKAGM